VVNNVNTAPDDIKHITHKTYAKVKNICIIAIGGHQQDIHEIINDI
jgi:hypothetical protein